MSAYKRLLCDFKNKERLITAIEISGYKPNIYENAQPLSGYRGDLREQTAEIIIPREQLSHSSNDLGFKFNKDREEYIAICSDFDERLPYLNSIKQNYSILVVEEALLSKGYKVNTKRNENKNVQVIGERIG